MCVAVGVKYCVQIHNIWLIQCIIQIKIDKLTIRLWKWPKILGIKLRKIQFRKFYFFRGNRNLTQQTSLNAGLFCAKFYCVKCWTGVFDCMPCIHFSKKSLSEDARVNLHCIWTVKVHCKSDFIVFACFDFICCLWLL